MVVWISKFTKEGGSLDDAIKEEAERREPPTPDFQQGRVVDTIEAVSHGSTAEGSLWNARSSIKGPGTLQDAEDSAVRGPHLSTYRPQEEPARVTVGAGRLLLIMLFHATLSPDLAVLDMTQMGQSSRRVSAQTVAVCRRVLGLPKRVVGV